MFRCSCYHSQNQCVLLAGMQYVQFGVYFMHAVGTLLVHSLSENSLGQGRCKLGVRADAELEPGLAQTWAKANAELGPGQVRSWARADASSGPGLIQTQGQGRCTDEARADNKLRTRAETDLGIQHNLCKGAGCIAMLRITWCSC